MVKNKSILRSHNMKNISYQQSAHLSSISVIKESDPDESDPDESDPDESDPGPNSELEKILKETQTALNRELNKKILAPVMQIKRQIQPILQQIQSPSPLVKNIIQQIETLKPEILKEQLEIVSQLSFPFKLLLQELQTMNVVPRIMTE